MDEHFVIIGAGQAAAQAVQTLRQKNFPGRLTVIGDEPYPPYQRPPLSKKYLAGELARERLYLKPMSFYEDKDVALELGVRAEGLETASSTVRLDDGRTITYDRLLLATGSRVRRLPIPGNDLAGVHYVRTIADADAIMEAIAPGKRLVIVGAGYIGLEVAAVAVQRGLHVTVLEAMDRVMARVVSPEVSRFYADYHLAAGASIHCDAVVARFSGEQRVASVETEQGERFPCDLVIVGIGIEPHGELARAAGLAFDDGIVVDEFACTEDPHVLAAGDCTNHPNALTGTRVRLESVHNAIEQAKTAASTMLGEPKAYDDVPWFWSDQYDLKLQIAGLSHGFDEIVIRGTPQDNSFAVLYLKAGTLIAVEAVNSPREFMLGRKLIGARAAVTPEQLADQSVNFVDLAKRLMS